MNLSSLSAKKIIAKRLGVSPDNFILLRLGGWVENIDSPAFQNGFANAPDPVGYDAAFPAKPVRFQATVAIKTGQTVGQAIFVDIDYRDIEDMVAAAGDGEYALDA